MSTATDFQNGFLCGMATKGMVKGSRYTPIIWNDDGEYDHFYIDFKRGLEGFSSGMLAESMIVHDAEQLLITGFSKVSNGVYKIMCDISGKVSGITVLHKTTSYLKFLGGVRVPVFSVHMYIEGIASYLKADYMYDSVVYVSNHKYPDTTFAQELTTWGAEGSFGSEEIIYPSEIKIVNETITITLT